uniref:(northern house mosquito) hypothetical protein n=1 Tax=Culex pipiens TaxID=7175 RepID=A0A8D8PL17_CULPI
MHSCAGKQHWQQLKTQTLNNQVRGWMQRDDFISSLLTSRTDHYPSSSSTIVVNKRQQFIREPNADGFWVLGDVFNAIRARSSCGCTWLPFLYMVRPTLST